MSAKQQPNAASTTFDDWDDVGAPASSVVVPPTSQVEAQTDPEPSKDDEDDMPLPPPPSTCPHPVQQIDIIVLDVSGSMKSRSSIDPDQTREDVSKIVFHTFVDKMMCLEMDHAVGLVAFGESITVVQPVTRAYESFHDELGRQDANQNRTKLFDAIKYAAELAVYTRKKLASKPDEVVRDAPLRVFALTDGEDNASTTKPIEVSRFLQQSGVVLDVFPMACANAQLRAVSAASRGRCVDVIGVEQGVSLFEDETLLHLPSRLQDDAPLPPTETNAEFDALCARLAPPSPLQPQHAAGGAATTTSPSTAVVTSSATAATSAAGSAAIHTPVVSRANATEKLSNSNAVSAGAIKRIMKEYREAMAENLQVYLCDSDSTMSWKAVIQGPLNTPYEGGHFVLSIQFPSDYPFKPPRVMFLTPVFHCNVNATGGICLDILKSAWSPALTISKVMMSLSSMLAEPNADDPLDVVKAQLFRDNRAEYDRQVRASVAQHAADLTAVLSAAGIDLTKS